MAEQQEPVHRKVALKIVKPGMDTKNVIARFEAERQALALMDHPNISQIFDGGATESGRPYFVMELVRGKKITDYCNEHSLTTEARLELFVQVCDAVQNAHQKGIIHRDIKPSNVLVTTTGEGRPLPKIIDFGIAKATTNQRLTDKTLFTTFQMLVGTLDYMSPEQAAITGVDVDTRSDIYSMGVLLYELLTGTTPFDTRELLKAGLDHVRRVIQTDEPVCPSTRLRTMMASDLKQAGRCRQAEPPKLIRSVKGDLDWIVMKALEKDRTRRYQTSTGLAEDIQRYLASDTVSARPPSAFYKLQKVVLRNKLLFASIGIIVSLLITGLSVATWLLAGENRARHEAEADKKIAQTEAAKSHQVKQFLEEMLQGVGPNVALGRDTTILHEILDQAVARVGKELTNQPAVEAELRSVIGTLYYRTGQLQKAEEMQRTALAIRRKQSGLESPETAAALNELGLTLMANGKLSEAEQVNREALDIRQRCFGNDNADVATSQNNLAQVYSQNGKLKEGEALAREALATRQRLFGDDSLEVADSLRTLAVILGNKHQWGESEAIARQVLEMRRKKLGPEHPWVASALNDVAWAAGGNGKQKEAEALERESLAMRQRLLSPEHPDVAASLYLVGDRMRQQGNPQEAYSVLSAALSIQRKVLGEDHPATLHTLKSIGLTYKAESRWPEAETVFREVLAAWGKRVGNDDLRTVYTLRDLADALEGQGKWAEAESLHQEALIFWRKREVNGGSDTSYTLHKLALADSAQGKWSQAETLYREELALRRKLTGNDDPDTLFSLRNLGITLEYQGKWGEAESLHREELASWRKQVGDDDPQTIYALEKLGSTLESEGKLPEAESGDREALALRRKKVGNDSMQTLSEYENLTRVLVQQKKFGEAEQLLNEALAPEVIGQPQSCNLLIQRLDLMGRQGRWSDAAAAASLLVKYKPTEQYPYHNLAALLAITKNRPAYAILCRKILATFTNTTDPFIDERIAKDCLFLPDSGVEVEFVDKLADKSVTLGSGHPDALPYFQVAKAMSAYRLGRSAEAIEWGEKTLKGTIIFPNAHACAILAMAHWRLGHKDVARVMLAKGNSLAPKISPIHEAVDLGDSWVAWIEARTSLDEAGQLIPPDAETK
jgi:serine/threonine protein kinase